MFLLYNLYITLHVFKSTGIVLESFAFQTSLYATSMYLFNAKILCLKILPKYEEKNNNYLNRKGRNIRINIIFLSRKDVVISHGCWTIFFELEEMHFDNHNYLHTRTCKRLPSWVLTWFKQAMQLYIYLFKSFSKCVICFYQFSQYTSYIQKETNPNN